MRILTLGSLLFAGGLLAPAQTANGWHLIWSDEFNGAADTLPDSAKWNYDLGGGGWGNGEQETYTNSANDAFQDGQGNLVIRAIKDASGNFTSARLRSGLLQSSDKVDLNWRYGKIEARIKLPFGAGVWPAFWMLGSNIATVGWPTCGEIDILENFGANFEDASTVHGTMHGPGYSGGNGIGAPYQLPRQQKFTGEFHIFSIEWAQDSVRFFVDGANYETVTPASLPSGQRWVFNNPFFILLNLAIGGPGTFLGTPKPDTPFPQDMLVDYVRVYQASTLPVTTPAISPGGVINGASGFGTVTPGSLASIYGLNLADAIYTSGSGLFQNGAFATATPSGVSVNVNGVNAPLIYVSPAQINFQIPWETALAPAPVNVTVSRGGATSEVEPVTVSRASPSVFLDYTTGAALITVYTDLGITPGAVCVLYGNGFGPKITPDVDGEPTPSAPISAIETANLCALTIAGQTAIVQYCGAAPGEVIDQLNFVYPAGVPVGSEPVVATLTIAGVTGTFLIDAPKLF